MFEWALPQRAVCSRFFRPTSPPSCPLILFNLFPSRVLRGNLFCLSAKADTYTLASLSVLRFDICLPQELSFLQFPSLFSLPTPSEPLLETAVFGLSGDPSIFPSKWILNTLYAPIRDQSSLLFELGSYVGRAQLLPPPPFLHVPFFLSPPFSRSTKVAVLDCSCFRCIGDPFLFFETRWDTSPSPHSPPLSCGVFPMKVSPTFSNPSLRAFPRDEERQSVFWKISSSRLFWWSIFSCVYGASRRGNTFLLFRGRPSSFLSMLLRFTPFPPSSRVFSIFPPLLCI